MTGDPGECPILSLAIEPVDLVVLLAYLLAVVVIGVSVGRGAKDLSAYLLGDRHLPWWAILGSIVATETSTATFLSVPGMAYDSQRGDLRFLQLALGFIVGRVLIVWLLLPWYFRGQLFTAYQLLEERFGSATKRVASVVFLVTRNLGDGLRLFLTAIVLEKVAGFPLPVCIVVIGVATILYTFFGGMRAVVWNDCLQFVVYMVGGLVAGAIILQTVAGRLVRARDVRAIASEVPRLRFSVGLERPVHLLGGTRRRAVPDAGNARDRPDDGPAVSVGAVPDRCGTSVGVERRRGLSAVHPVSVAGGRSGQLLRSVSPVQRFSDERPRVCHFHCPPVCRPASD